MIDETTTLGVAVTDIPKPALDRRITIQQTVPRVSVVIPTLNEAENLPYIFSRMPADVHEVILVDGNSTDATIAMARALYPSVRVIIEEARGKGCALRSGFAACTGELVVTLDADGSMDPMEIPFFVSGLCHGADVVKGSRTIVGGSSSDFTAPRRIGNWVLTKLVNILFHTRYTDINYGYSAFWRRCLPDLAIDCDGFEIETVIMLRATRAGMRVIEVPSVEHRRAFGASKLNACRDGWRVQKAILREKFRPASSGCAAARSEI